MAKCPKCGWVMERLVLPLRACTRPDCTYKEDDSDPCETRGGHDIELNENGLAFCKRCHGGEVELETPCVERLADQLAQVKTENTKQLRIILGAPGWDEVDFKDRYHKWWRSFYYDAARAHPEMARAVRFDEDIDILEDQMPWFEEPKGPAHDNSRTRASLLANIVKLRKINAMAKAEFARMGVHHKKLSDKAKTHAETEEHLTAAQIYMSCENTLRRLAVDAEQEEVPKESIERWRKRPKTEAEIQRRKAEQGETT